MRWLGPVMLAMTVTAARMHAVELHVAVTGSDTNPGTRAQPFRTIQKAADTAMPGDTITVHAGLYRERVNPPRGGSPDRRIVYRAAPGERVEIRGSEVVTGWKRVRDDVWSVTIPNTFFGAFNPFADEIRGDWFDPLGRAHHTGAVYMDGAWLAEAATLEQVLDPEPAGPYPAAGGPTLLNVAWLRPERADARRPAVSYSGQFGVRNAPCDEGGECVGWIERGDWVRYDSFDFSGGARRIELRVASATSGGVIELRLDKPTGPIIGTAEVPHTGGWQSWISVESRIRPTRGVRTLYLVFRDRGDVNASPGVWFARVGPADTTVWARFIGADPTKRQTEVNVRRTVFYPDAPGRDWITVRGFTMRHAATPWAPPTAEQIGLIGTHWSRGWIIEDCVISHSICSGIALGKHGDEFDNTSANTAEGYVRTIERALARGWNRETIGGHIVRNNTISHCEQAGIVGSLGAAFCTITNNTIHDIHIRRLFSGAEMAGIKFHGAVDTVIEGNRIRRTCMGLWLDWMAQGTRVTRNLFSDNLGPDLFVEVNHGPFLVDHNLFLSPASLLDVSEGGAYAHNLFLGAITTFPEPNRETPYHPAHSTELAGLATVRGGDDRFVHNLFAGPASVGLHVYDGAVGPLIAEGNAYLGGARPSSRDVSPVVVPDIGLIRLVEKGRSLVLQIQPPPELLKDDQQVVSTRTLGRTRLANLPYEAADGSPITLDRDWFGKPRQTGAVIPGPFATLRKGRSAIRLR